MPDRVSGVGYEHQSTRELSLSGENKMSVVNYTSPTQVMFQQPTNRFPWKMNTFPYEFMILQDETQDLTRKLGCVHATVAL